MNTRRLLRLRSGEKFIESGRKEWRREGQANRIEPQTERAKEILMAIMVCGECVIKINSVQS